MTRVPHCNGCLRYEINVHIITQFTARVFGEFCHVSLGRMVQSNLLQLILQLSVAHLQRALPLRLPVHIFHQSIYPSRDSRLFLRLQELERRQFEVRLLYLLPRVVQLLRQYLRSGLFENKATCI